MYPAYLLILFHVERDMIPANARCKYIDKKLWLSLQDSLIKEIGIDGRDYRIESRRSFRIGDLSGVTMVVQLDIAVMPNVKKPS